jgi:hypothetical protein
MFKISKLVIRFRPISGEKPGRTGPDQKPAGSRTGYPVGSYMGNREAYYKVVSNKDKQYDGNSNLFATRYSKLENVSELFKKLPHLFFLKVVRYVPDIHNTHTFVVLQ